MKKTIFIASVMGLALASCQSDDLEPAVVSQGDGNVTFHLSAPEAMEYSRAITAPNSALGGISNVDWANYDLRYKLAVYQVNETESGTTTRLVIPAQTVTVDTYSDVDFSLRLTPNRKYTFVVWADFVNQGSQADLHYNTSDLENITCKDDVTAMLNDESRDAYFVTETIEVTDAGLSQSLTLRRPFAKLRVIATDWGIGKLDMPDEFDVTYYGCKRFEGINARTGETITTTDLAADCATTYHATIVKDTKEYSLGYDSSDRNRTLIVDYLVAQPAQSTIHFKLAPNEGLPVRDFTTDIPIRRNWLTTILGDLLTTGADIHILCDEGFTDEYNGFDSTGSFNPVAPYIDAAGVYHIKTADELAWISENVATLSAATVVLDSDIDLRGIDWKPIYTYYQYISLFDGQGHTIYNLAITGASNAYPFNGTNYLGLFSQARYITIQNLNLENVSINSQSGHAGALVGMLGVDGGGVEGNIIKNCNAKHVFIRPVLYNEDRSYSSFNAGGLVGILHNGDFDNCHVSDVNIQSGWRVGGIVGYHHIYCTANMDVKFENCSVTDATLWITWRQYEDDYERYDYYQLMQIGSLSGCIDGDTPATNSITFNSCSRSNITYVIGGHSTSSSTGWEHSNTEDGFFDVHTIQGAFFLHDGDEAASGTHTLTTPDGVVIPYGPLHKFFGQACDCKVMIDGTEDTSGYLD